MGRASLLAVLAAGLAGCGLVEPGGLMGRPTYVEPEPEPLQRPIPPPERFLRVPVNFRFRDDAVGREFLLRMYRDEEIEDNVVSVLDEGSAVERLASEEEFAFAMERFVRTWIEAGEEEQLSRFREAVERERSRRATLLDELLRLKRATVAGLEDEIRDLRADLDSIRRTGYRAPPGRTEFLQGRIALADSRLVAETAELRLLESRRRLRDGDAGLDDLEELLAE